MAQNSGKFQAYIDGFVDINEIEQKNLKESALFRQFCTVRDTNKLVEREVEVGNMGMLGMTPEDAIPGEMTFNMGYSHAWTQTMWTGRVYLTEFMELFQQRGLATRLNSQLQEAPWKTLEFLGASYIDYADVATSPTIGNAAYINTKGGDGLALFSSAHTYNGNPTYTYANKSGAAADISETSINTYYQVLMGIKDDRGIPLNLKFKGLIYHPAQTMNALKAVKSRLEHFTANNAINTVQDLMKAGVQMIEHQWITSTRWCFMTDARDADLRFYMGQEPTFRISPPHPDTGARVMRETMATAHGSNRLLSLFLVAA